MRYLAQLTLERAEALRRELFGPYEWHILSWTFFPDKKKAEKFIKALKETLHKFHKHNLLL